MLSDEEMLRYAIQFVSDNDIGLLTTVGADGQPYARYMTAAVMTDQLRDLYTFSAKGTRKIEQIRSNANVCWVFAAPEYDDVVTLYGTASVEESPEAVRAAWEQVVQAVRAYAPSPIPAATSGVDEAQPAMVAIHTKVQRAEYLSPRLGILQPRELQLG